MSDFDVPPPESGGAVERLVILLAVGAILALGACSSIRRGGAPDPSFDIDKDLEQLAKEFDSATNISNFYKAPSKAARNRFVTGRLVQIDLRYLQFIRNLTADKQNLDSATEIALLSLNLAGTAVGSTQAKTNLSAVAAGVTGTKSIIDKNYYFEKSVDALVASMNARRKDVLIRIFRGLPLPLEQYPLTQAITDLNEYYLAGTLNGAIQFIQSEAGQKERQSDVELKKLREAPPLPPEATNVKKQLTDSIGAPDLKLENANKALRALNVAQDKLPSTLKEAQVQLQKFVLEARTPEAINKVKSAFESAGILR